MKTGGVWRPRQEHPQRAYRWTVLWTCRCPETPSARTRGAAAETNLWVHHATASAANWWRFCKPGWIWVSSCMRESRRLQKGLDVIHHARKQRLWCLFTQNCVVKQGYKHTITHARARPHTHTSRMCTNVNWIIRWWFATTWIRGSADKLMNTVDS